MGAPIPLRKDFNAKQLRALAYRSGEGAQRCRLLARALLYDGQDRSTVARVAGVELQIIRKWVLRFNAQGPEGLKDRKAEGPPHKLNQQQREALAAIVESGPDPEIHGVVRWQLWDLVVGWIKENFGVSVVETTVGRELHRMGYVKLSARPRHYAQDPTELAAFKTSRAHQGNTSCAGRWRRRG